VNRPPSSRGLLLALAVSFAAVASASCAKQGEGERCAVENGNEDCDTGLVCVNGAELGQSSDVCCPKGASNDKRCNPIVGTGGGGGGTTTTTSAPGTTSSTTTSMGGGGAGGNGGTGGGGNGGTGGTGGAGGAGGM
jgi:hypothetical protein